MVPPWALLLLCLSKRVHSIFLLRLFNDGPAMLLAHAGAAALLSRRPRLAVLLFSAATSVKMNVLLMAPSVLVVLLKARLRCLMDPAAIFLRIAEHQFEDQFAMLGRVDIRSSLVDPARRPQVWECC